MTSEDKYRKPPHRDEIQNSDRGGKPGQWSARNVLSTTVPPNALILPGVISDVRAPSNDGIRIKKARRRLQHPKIFDGMGSLIKRGLKGTRGRKQRTRKKGNKKAAQEANAVLSRMKHQKKK